MRRFPFYVNGEIAMERITRALTEAGFHVRCDVNGMTVVDEVPGIVRRAAPPSNAVPFRRAKQR